jgi:glutamyl-tRNA reductase
VIVVVGLSHRNTPLAVRERIAIPRGAIPGLIERLTRTNEIGEAVVLSTCNRVEVYAAPKSRGVGDPGLALTAEAVRAVLASVGGAEVAAHLVAALGHSAVLHLFRVAASLDSLVVGEPQILGQLKDAIEMSRQAKALGATLGRAMHRAVRVGKRVRTETAIGAGQVSIPSVAVDLARQIFGDLQGHTAVLLGAGDMAETASRLLARGGARLLIVNRSPERAAALAKEVGGEAHTFGDLHRTLVEADMVIASTASPGFVITEDLVRAVRKSRKGRSLFLVDIAVPRDIEPTVNQLENVYLYDIDDLSQIVAGSRDGRATEAARAEAILRDEADGYRSWTLEQTMTPTILGLRARTHAVLSAELAKTLSGKLRHLGEADRDALRTMIDAATNKLLHTPVTRLRGCVGDPRADDYLHAVTDLFALEIETAEAEAQGEADTLAGEDDGDSSARAFGGRGEPIREPAQLKTTGQS